MIMYEAEHIKDSQGNQWSKKELKWWDFAHQLFQVRHFIWKNFSSPDLVPDSLESPVMLRSDKQHRCKRKCEVSLQRRTISKQALSIKSQGTVFTFPIQGQTLGGCCKWVKVEVKTKVRQLTVEVQTILLCMLIWSIILSCRHLPAILHLHANI